MSDEDDQKKRGKSGHGSAGRDSFAGRRSDTADFPGKPRAASSKPFATRRDEAGQGSSKRDFGTRGEGREPGGFKRRSGKPFAKRERADGERPGRNFEKREHSGFEKRERPGAVGKPFQKRDHPGPERRHGGRERAAGAGTKHGAETFGRGSKFDRGPISTEVEQTDQSERIAKRLARAGIASRRDAEALIADGRVKVNGAVISSPALNVSPSDRIELDGTEIPAAERTRLFLFHKPAGVVTTNRDPEGRRTVFEVLPNDLPRLITVGRLDINTEGLLLLTNDGGLARVLELPATGWLRRYRVRVHGKVEETALAELRQGMAVDGVFYGGIEASLDREQGSNAWLTLGLREGKNREVKNVLGALGLDVTRLIRVSYGPFQLGELPEGSVQELKGRTLREQLGERLIEEAGANFEAPIVRPFPNRPVSLADERRVEAQAERPRPPRNRVEEGEGGLIKRRHWRDRADDRASALSRLTTKPDAGRASAAKGKFDAGKGKPFAKGRDKPQDRAEPSRARTSNVWMAPGARPQGKKSEAVTPPSPRSRGEGKSEGRRFDKTGEGRRFDKKAGDSAEKRQGGASSGIRPSSHRKRGEGGKGKPGADRRR